LFLKGRLRNELSTEERLALEGSIERTVSVRPRTTLVEAGQRLERSFYLIEGVMLRYVESPQGTRQLVHISLPGDFVDLHGYPTKRLDHNVSALTPCELAEFSHGKLTQLLSDHQHLARAMWFSTLLDAAIHRAWIRMMGHLTAEARVAYVIVELIERLKLIERFDGHTLEIPLLQRDYADACGITDVHTNRCFRTLQERGLLKVRRGSGMVIHDLGELQRLADFSPEYLYGEGALKVGNLEDR
jgi:CRP-like cAMP-binding protein